MNKEVGGKVSVSGRRRGWGNGGGGNELGSNKSLIWDEAKEIFYVFMNLTTLVSDLSTHFQCVCLCKCPLFPKTITT
jgi:hypothetical protein